MQATLSERDAISETYVNAKGFEPTTTSLVNEHSTIKPKLDFFLQEKDCIQKICLQRTYS